MLMNTHRGNNMSQPRKGLTALFTALTLAGMVVATVHGAPVTEFVTPEKGAMELSIGRDGLAPIKAVAGKSFIIRTGKIALKRISVSDPTVVDYTLLSPTELYMLPKRYGSTNITMWTKDDKTAVIDLNVEFDTGELEAKLAELLPNERNIRVTTAAKSIVLTGTVSSPMAMSQVLDLADAYVRYINRDIVMPIVSGGGDVASGTKISVGGGSNIRQARQVAGVSVINMLSVAEPMQVMLEVKVAEVSKGLLDRLGAAIGKLDGSGAATITNSANGDSASLLSAFLAGTLSNPVNGLLTLTIGDTLIRIDAEKGDDIFRLLAEPNIMAISGQEGSFLSGGTVYAPTGSLDANGNPVTGPVDFGVRLRFVPTVLANGRINLQVEPEVSEPSPVSVSESSLTFVKRKAATTVQLNDGQSFAIAGLIKSNMVESVKRLPILGEIPILGSLFRSSAFQESKSELMFIVTPRLVKPLPPNYRLPTDNFKAPDRAEFFLGGRMESAAPPAPSQAPAAPAATPAKANPDQLRMN
jgi:pilus assembly protein CpaC